MPASQSTALALPKAFSGGIVLRDDTPEPRVVLVAHRGGYRFPGGTTGEIPVRGDKRARRRRREREDEGEFIVRRLRRRLGIFVDELSLEEVHTFETTFGRYEVGSYFLIRWDECDAAASPLYWMSIADAFHHLVPAATHHHDRLALQAVQEHIAVPSAHEVAA